MQVIQESIIEKAKDFISKHKGKLIAAAAIGGAGFLGYKLGQSNASDTKNITNISITINRYNKSPTDTKSPVNDTHTNMHANTHNAQLNFGSSKIINDIKKDF